MAQIIPSIKHKTQAHAIPPHTPPLCAFEKVQELYYAHGRSRSYRASWAKPIVSSFLSLIVLPILTPIKFFKKNNFFTPILSYPI